MQKQETSSRLRQNPSPAGFMLEPWQSRGPGKFTDVHGWQMPRLAVSNRKPSFSLLRLYSVNCCSINKLWVERKSI
jgi:hypothetical protein